jgi:putative ABC transport system substrate-binding protein
LREVIPKLVRLAILFDGGYAATVQEKDEVHDLARTLGLEVVPQEIRRAEDIASAFAALKGQADALYVTENALIFTNRETIIALALDAELPTTCTNADIARAGALMSYGPNFPALFRRAVEIVDKILRGIKQGDIPVEQPTKFDLVINLKTAKVLGLTISDKMLALADELIE